jgi:lysophospholipase L1-like esterase
MLSRISALVLLMGFLAHLAVAAPVLKAGDRLVIYGDSITEQRLYSRFVQQYLYCRYPELKLAVYNAGWGGDRAPGALTRLERDVLWLNPTVVTLFFGMNDGGYAAVTPNTLATYKTGMEGLIKALQARNVRPVVFTPGCVDPDRRPALKDNNYNATLEALGKTALELATQYTCPSADVHHPMLAYQTARKAENAGFTMIGDAVHPDAMGHLVMTFAMLQGLGAEPMPAMGVVDLAANTADGLKVVSNAADKIVLETLAPLPVPFWVDAGALPTLRASGFLDFALPKLTVRGLPAEAYSLSVDGTRLGRVTAASLAAGYAVPSTYSARGKLLHDFIARKEGNYFSAWREFRLPLANDAAAKDIVTALMATDDAYQKYIQSLATPTGKTTIELVPVPATANLAEGKPYLCSDPNTKGWNTGLTDGSWEAKQTLCFATNDGPAFPKTVTLDLEKATTIATVIAGVPAFGSTKTIAVAVSADGKTFSEAGTHDFSLRKEERFTYKFAPVEARYIRLTYPNHYDESVAYPTNFVFTTEVEVYGPEKAAVK